MAKICLNESSVKKKFGISPSQMIDYQAMVGDSVDNITGIQGVGAKNRQQTSQSFHKPRRYLSQH